MSESRARELAKALGFDVPPVVRFPRSRKVAGDLVSWFTVGLGVRLGWDVAERILG